MTALDRRSMMLGAGASLAMAGCPTRTHIGLVSDRRGANA
jgi:hypothetical protein